MHIPQSNFQAVPVIEKAGPWEAIEVTSENYYNVGSYIGADRCVPILGYSEESRDNFAVEYHFPLEDPRRSVQVPDGFYILLRDKGIRVVDPDGFRRVYSLYEEPLYYDDQTLNRVVDALSELGIDKDRAQAVITTLQNHRILFREISPPEE